MHTSKHQAICTITYHLVERIAGWYDQTTNRTAHYIHLYADSISTTKNSFKLEHVLDMSYKPFSGGAGLFYLHTNQGVFMFEIDTDPTSFIQAYRKLRQ
ncbi:hypothetical protein [Sporosarcina beigongshangi]|uniref:hypothetical protein n=1 Tax=Sporosarcina beigongshangi TaxID=2782538 RepID=UPI00193AA027|nr:hypothetical protein [Sporosarcina beigongshangi]